MHCLDYTITCPLRPSVLGAWTRTQRDLAENPDNPASLHAGGRQARRMLEDAHEHIGAALSVHRSEIVFTSGATESNVLVVVGGTWLVYCGDPRRSIILMSILEHDVVKE